MQSDLGKLFIGGISWDTDEERLKEYFSSFGEVLEAVIMKDRTTGRARGFGFIVFADPVVADRVIKEKHNIDGRLVEAKKAVPKDDHSSVISRNSGSIQGSPGPVRTRKIFVGGGLGVRMDGRFSPITAGRTGFAPFGSGYGMNLNLGMNPNYGGNVNLNNSVSYERGMNPYYNSNRFNNPAGFDGGNLGNTASLFNSQPRNLWGNGGLDYGTNPTNSSGYVGSGTGSIGARNLGINGLNWDSSPISPQAQGGRNVSNQAGILGYGGVDGSYNLGVGAYGRNSASTGARMSSHSSSNGGYDATFGDIYSSRPVYGDSTWHSANSEQEESGAFSYGLGDGPGDAQIKSAPGYVDGYGVSRRQTNRGITG
ncbi:Heterogeneous nuclear ribonucleoprotein 1 [Heracleum sosnowskyi]|uniref:Heterogeneous nuclear ribonucleoprotein 1 n=1 Tax=Heracleum sosnowskyi TaxID=360622 RepID=A0AAD8ISB3_9APIA|nr:Heterogeneous nuclear ribonucleoprotein 1 [Heracleum sosnowskyi]